MRTYKEIRQHARDKVEDKLIDSMRFKPNDLVAYKGRYIQLLTTQVINNSVHWMGFMHELDHRCSNYVMLPENVLTGPIQENHAIVIDLRFESISEFMRAADKRRHL